MDAGGYDERFKKWRYDDLPILPEPFRYVLAPGKEDAFENLRALMNRPNVDTIVNACDAGREGELIFRLVYEMAECRKPILRLWISSMEDSAIREAFLICAPAPIMKHCINLPLPSESGLAGGDQRHAVVFRSLSPHLECGSRSDADPCHACRA